MIEVKEGLKEDWIELFFKEINETSMKRSDYQQFKNAYENRDVILSLWNGNNLVGFGSMLTDWHMNSIIYDVVFNKEGSSSIPISFADVPSGIPLAGHFYTSGNNK